MASTRLLRLGITKVKTVVDVGANIGYFVREVMDVFNLPACCIHAIEPQRKCIEELEKFKGGLHIYHFAAGAGYGVAEMFLCNEDQASSLLRMQPEVGKMYGVHLETVGTETVLVRPIDDLMPADLEPDILKIDVQGYELSVLAGAQRLLQKTRHVIIECNCVSQYEGGSMVYPVSKAMVEYYNFRLEHLFAPNCGTDNDRHYDERIMLHCDAHFVRNDA